MDRIKTFDTGVSVYPSDLNDLQDDYASILNETYKDVGPRSSFLGAFGTVSVGFAYWFGAGPVGTFPTTANQVAHDTFHINSADRPANTETRYRLRAYCRGINLGPGTPVFNSMTLKAKLYGITITPGVSGSPNTYDKVDSLGISSGVTMPLEYEREVHAVTPDFNISSASRYAYTFELAGTYSGSPGVELAMVLQQKNAW